jgi:hypothetical protein
VHQDPGEEDTPWSREGEEQWDLEMNTKLDPTSLEVHEGRRGSWPAQDPVKPAPRPDHPVPGPVNRAPNRIPCLVLEGDRKLRKFPVGARSTGPRTGPPGHRPGQTGSKPGLTGMTHQTALSYPFAYLFALAGHVCLYK